MKLNKKNIIKCSLYALLLLFVCILMYSFSNSCVKGFTLDIENDTDMSERSEKYENLMKDFNTIFPDRNRNAGGPQFFKHIVDMNLNKHDFELYNSFYCGVSGSPVDPKRSNVFDYVVVKDLEGNDIYGKYYRCCWPCLCDIMKYAKVDKYDANLNDTCVTYDVLTIDDPCCNISKIPKSVSSFECENGKTQNGVYSRNGRLIFALFYDTKIATESDNINDVLKRCKERMDTMPDDLQGGMGDIFVKLSLACKDNNDGFSVGMQNHSSLKNIYGEPLQPCKTSNEPGSWDNEGYCSEMGGGVHQICMHVTEEHSDFSTETHQSDWSKDRVGNNHCMCLGAWALYKAKGKGDGEELVCNSITDMSLDPSYVSNWNTWNGYEHLKKDGKPNDQIIDGVDSMVQQCYDKKNSKYLKDKYDTLRESYNKKSHAWDSVI
jgi:uncharacterized protein (DUF2237 family)